MTASGVGVGEAVPDQHRANSLNTGWVKVPVKFPALAVVAKRGDRVKRLAERIGDELEVGQWKHCAIYEEELKRVWPENEKHREAKIAQFAKANGFRLRHYRKGLCAIFDKPPK